MKTINTFSTLLAMTVAMGVANVSFANPVATPSVTTQTTTQTAVKQTPKKVVKKTVTVRKSGFKCKDGSLSKAKSTRGACSGHGGIAK